MAFSTSKHRLDEAEEALGRRFPEPMRSRLARSNGGEIGAGSDDWTLNPVRDPSDRKRLARSANDIVGETQLARQWSGFPESGVAVAGNGTGDMLVLLPGSDDIHIWSHETGDLYAVTVEWD